MIRFRHGREIHGRATRTRKIILLERPIPGLCSEVGTV